MIARLGNILASNYDLANLKKSQHNRQCDVFICPQTANIIFLQSLIR